MSIDIAARHKEIVARFIETIWNRGQTDQFAAFAGPGYTDDAYTPADASGHRNMVDLLKRVIPDARWTIERMVADEISVVCELTLRGRHQGEFRGIGPAGNAIEVRAYRTFVFDGDKIMRHSALLDTATLVKQMQARAAA